MGRIPINDGISNGDYFPPSRGQYYHRSAPAITVSGKWKFDSHREYASFIKEVEEILRGDFLHHITCGKINGERLQGGPA